MSLRIGIGTNLRIQSPAQSWSAFWDTRTPSNIILTVLSATSIKVDWTNLGTGYDGHKIERSDDNGLTFSVVGTVLGTTKTFSNTGLTNGATYVYRVRAYKGTNYSPYADEVMTTISTLLNGLVFALKWDGSQFINAVTGLALVNNGGVTNGNSVLPNTGVSAGLAIAQNQYLSTPDTADLSMGDVDFTVAVFGKLTDTTRAAIQSLAAQYDSVNNQRAWLLQCRTDGILRLSVSNDGINVGSNIVSIVGAIADNSSNLVLAWHDAANNQLGIQLNNGTPVTAATVAAGIFDSNADITIGAIDDGTLLADGNLNVLIWKNKLLNATEKEFLYNAGNGNQFPFNLYDVFIMAGQSNASGRSTNSQVFTKTGNYESLLFANDYKIKDIVDPTDSTTNQVDAVSLDSTAPDGSIYPIIASSLSALNKKTMFIPCAMGGTYIADWQPGANHVDRTTLYGSMVYRAKQIRSVGGNLRAVLWWQGEADSIIPATDKATYNAAIDVLANTIKSDLGISFMPCKLHILTVERDNTNVNEAIVEAWGDNDNVLIGPDLSDIAQDDTNHIRTDVKTATIATRWVTTIRAAFGW